MARPSTICPHVLDLIHMLMRTNQQQYRVLGAYVFRDGDRAAAEQDVFGPPGPKAMLVEDECPEGYHLQNGVCVPN